MAKAAKAEKGNNGANLGYEAKLFAAADKMRSGVSPSEYCTSSGYFGLGASKN